MADAISSALNSSQRDSEGMRSFGYRLKNQFSLNAAYRRPKELEWLESLRQYKGLYDPGVVIAPGASRVYPKITRSKVNIVLSRLHEMLFPETDKNWEILPTPEPSISQQQVMQIAQGMITQDPETGQPIIPTPEDLLIAIRKFAKSRCEAMSIQMDDQLTEMQYSEETKKVLRSGLMYGTGVMKGPLISSATMRKWEAGENGEYNEAAEDRDIPFYECTRIWDWYPDMTVTDIDKIEGTFERHLMTKHDLRLLVKRPDFYGDIITEYLTNHPSGDYVPKAWETDLQVIEVEAGTKQEGQYTTTTSSSLTLDESSRSTYRQIGKKYEMLEYWGYVDGSDLEACGISIDDPLLEYGANVWLLGGIPVKVVLFEGALDKYKVFYYEKDETSIFGEGLARIMRHSQLSISAAARMVLDNGACVAGPNVEVNWSLCTPDTDLTSFYPRKIWFREGRGVEAQYPAIRALNFDSHVEELLTIVDAFKQFGDEETTLPTWMIGQMVNNETAQATSGRMSTITISIKDVVKNFDSFTEKIMRDLYAWNMEFNPREDIKGDFKARARGVSSLVMKEIRMQALNQLSTTLLPEDWDYIDRREFLQERFKAHDIVIPLKTEEEVSKMREERENSIMNKLTIENLQAENAYKRSQTMAMLTKAKDKNIEAMQKANEPPEGTPQEDERIIQGDLALQQTDKMGKAAKIRQEEEKHAQEMAHAEEKHDLDMKTEAHKTATDIAIKQTKAEMDVEAKKADIKAKEELTKVKKVAMKKSASGINKPKPSSKSKVVK